MRAESYLPCLRKIIQNWTKLMENYWPSCGFFFFSFLTLSKVSLKWNASSGHPASFQKNNFNLSKVCSEIRLQLWLGMDLMHQTSWLKFQTPFHQLENTVNVKPKLSLRLHLISLHCCWLCTLIRPGFAQVNCMAFLHNPAIKQNASLHLNKLLPHVASFCDIKHCI